MKLHIYRRDTLERTLDLTGGDLRIGRGVENDLVLDDADKTVSRFHAELRQEQDEFILIDLHSENGTWIDGQRIQHATLSPGTTIAMGHFRLVLEDAGAAAARAANELQGLPVMVGHAHRGSSGTPAPPASSSSRADAHAAGHANAAMMSMAAAAGTSNASGASAHAGATKGASAPRAASTGAAANPRAAAAGIPRPVLYAACLVVVVLLVGIPYVFWPSGEPDGGQGVGSGTAEAAHARHQDDARRRAAANANTNAAGARMPGAASSAGTAAAGARTPGGANPPSESEQPSGSPVSAGASSASGSQPQASATQVAMQPSLPGPATLASVATGSSSASQPNPGVAASANSAAPARPLTRAERAAQAKREQAAANLYARGKAALAAGNFAEASTAFESVMREKPNHVDTATLLEQARTGVRNDAVKVASQAAALAAKGDFRGAIREYERARQIDPALEAAAGGIADVRAKMKSAGDDAYRRARQLEAVGRLQDATAQYTRAVDLLPADDANGKAARERLDMLTRQP